MMTSVNSTTCETGTVPPSVRAGPGVGKGPTDITTHEGGHARTGHGVTTMAALPSAIGPTGCHPRKSNHHMSTGASLGVNINLFVPVHLLDPILRDVFVAGHVIAHLSVTPSWASMV